MSAVPKKSLEQRFVELRARTPVEERLQRAHEQRRYWMTRNLTEYQYWNNRVREYAAELELVRAQRPLLSDEDKERYAEPQEEFDGSSNGSIDWSKA